MLFAIRPAIFVIASFAFFAAAFPVQAANVAPIISGTPPSSVFVGFRYRFVPAARDSNGDRLRFSIANKPAWASFDSATGRLAGTPAATGLYSDIVIRVSDGHVSRSLPAFSIRVRANHAPTISGTPANAVVAGTAYSFRPTAADSDGQVLKFSIVGKPAWASFSTSTGRLYGTPGNTAAGTYSGIRITVSDGKLSAKLPAFWITVRKSTTTANRAPRISGTPVTVSRVGRPYAFKPTAYDADGDSLAFKISGKPVWARFDTSNGTLYGTPTWSNTGVYRNIVIGVSDGKVSSFLAPFSITVGTATTGSVTLRWTAPTRNTDGTALTDLAGYKVFYGTVSRVYSKSVRLAGAGVTSVVIEGLTAGTWYFAMKSYDTSGVESAYSGEVKVSL